MRRSRITIAASTAALALVPAGALARDNGHQRHHKKHHHERVHHRSAIRHERFGSAASSTSSASSTDNAGTVRSFTGGVLTLALADGSTVSGRVTDRTEIECASADMSSIREDGDGGGSGGDQGDRGSDNEDGATSSCSASDLAGGATVQEAELRISSAGSTWDKVELAG